MKLLRYGAPGAERPFSADVRIAVPVSGIRQFMAIGLNYHDHAAESGMPAPAEPVVFTKAITSLAGPDDDVTLPAGSVAGDWELRRGGQWCKGKSFDGFGPLGRQYQRVL